MINVKLRLSIKINQYAIILLSKNTTMRGVKQVHANNTSSQHLMVQKRQSGNQQQIDQIEYQNIEKKRLKRQGLSHLYNIDYQPAIYKAALEYRNKRSYMKKVGENAYKNIELFQNTDELKAFGLGPYFLIEYMRRALWLFFFLSILQGIRIYINAIGTGLGDYSISFSTSLIMTTMGNFDGHSISEYDRYIMVIVPGVVFVTFAIWFLIWKKHYYAIIDEQEQSNTRVLPQKFCVQMDVDEKYTQEEQLEKFFSSFGPVYQVSLVRRYKNKLSYFEQLQELDEQLKEEELEIILGSGDQDHLKSLRKERDELNKYINTLKIQPKTLSAYIHYQYEKSKVDMLTFYNDRYLFDTAGHACCRSLCFCCIEPLTQSQKFRGQPMLVKAEKVPPPEDINWDSRQISAVSKFFRIIFGVLIIIVFIALSCAIIGLCSIYISGHSVDCEDVVVPETITAAKAENQSQYQKRCFCNANLFTSFNDASITDYCGSLLTELYTEQGIQWAVVVASGVTNFLFGLIVSWIVNFTRPQSNASGLLAKTIVYTTFMIFNSVILPLLIYADIFGFKTAQYLSFVTIISTDFKQFLQVDSITFQNDFNAIWYRNVSPIFSNSLIVETIVTWVFFIVFKCLSNKSGLQEDEKKILQKHMNEKITSYKFNVYVEYSYFNLTLVLGTVFSAGCPSLIPLTFICLFSKYIFTRSLIQNNSSRIQGLTEALQSFTFFLIPFLLFVSTLIGSWMLTGNSQVYPEHLKVGFTIDVPIEVLSSIVNRQLYLPWFIITAAAIAFYFFFYNTIVRFCSWLASLCYEKKIVTHPYHALPFSEYAKKLNVLYSYNIRNNDRYKNVIINLEKYLYFEKK